MNTFSYTATGVPLQQAPIVYVPHYDHQLNQQQAQQRHMDPTQQQQQQQQQQWVLHGDGNVGNGGKRGRRGEAGARVDVRNRDRIVERMIANPAFWATVFKTLQRYPDINEEIRRDLEEQERRVDRARERRRRGQAEEDEVEAEEGGRYRRNYNGGDDGAVVTTEDDERHRPSPTRGRTDATGGGQGVANGEPRPVEHDDRNDDDEEQQDRPRVDDLPDLYGYLAGDVENMRRTVGVQRLDVLLDELNIEALWSARDVTISFGPLAMALLRLFIGPYATDEERTIVRMLNLGMERAARNFGFEDSRQATSQQQRQSIEPFIVTYRRRGRVLRDFAAFRYMLQITENMGRIGQKHKNDLIHLYLTLTTPEIRLHRRLNAADSEENVIAFRDHITGYAISTPLVMARPMTIEMKLDSVFGNVSANSRLLERSLLAASKNRNRKLNGLSASQEVEFLMEDARLLDLSGGGGAGGGGGGGGVGDTNSMRAALKPYRIEREHTALRQMLEMSTVVSMMAEEFRVFVAGAPQSRGDGSSAAGGGASSRPHQSNQNNNNNKRSPHARQAYAFRRPIFFAFKPQSPAGTKKYE